MDKLLKALGKGVFIVAVAGTVMQRERAIVAFPEAVEAGDNAEADRRIAEAVNLDQTLRAAGLNPPPMPLT